MAHQQRRVTGRHGGVGAAAGRLMALFLGVAAHDFDPPSQPTAEASELDVCWTPHQYFAPQQYPCAYTAPPNLHTAPRPLMGLPSQGWRRCTWCR